MKKLLTLTTYCLLLTMLLGCGSNLRLYIHEEADFGYLEKIAVLPFVNLTNHQFASEKITDCFITELLIAGKFDIVDSGEVVKIIRENGVVFNEQNKDMDLATIKKIGEKLGVQAIIIGSVAQYEMVTISQEQYPAISINTRLIDVGTGKIAWMGSYVANGAPSGFLFFSFGEVNTLAEMTQIACKKIVDAIMSKAY